MQVSHLLHGIFIFGVACCADSGASIEPEAFEKLLLETLGKPYIRSYLSPRTYPSWWLCKVNQSFAATFEQPSRADLHRKIFATLKNNPGFWHQLAKICFYGFAIYNSEKGQATFHNLFLPPDLFLSNATDYHFRTWLLLYSQSESLKVVQKAVIPEHPFGTKLEDHYCMHLFYSKISTSLNQFIHFKVR